MTPSISNMTTVPQYSFVVTLPLPLPETEALVRDLLMNEKFGIISEIDLKVKFKEKLGIEHYPHKILGACNPQLAYTALQDNVDVALALPCNVVLYEKEPGTTTVSALLPSVALKPFTGLKVQESSCKAEEMLRRIFNDLSSKVLL